MNTNAFDWHYLLGSAPLLLLGLGLTVKIALTCIAISIAIGYVGASVLFFEVRVLRTIVRAYVAAIRNTPLLVQMFFFYFGLPEIGVRTSAIASGLIVLSIWGGAYQIENLRGALGGVPAHLQQSARALGLHPLRIYFSIQLPVATRTVVPAMMNTAVSTTKNSALLTAIGVPELTYTAMDNIANSARGLENFFALFVGYLFIVLVMSNVAHLIELRLGRGFSK